MSAFISLLSRNNKLFRRDYTSVFLSLLSVIIVIVLYIIFIQKTQLDAIEQILPASKDIRIMVNEWLIAGMLSLISVTTTLGAYSVYVRDLESNIMADFLTAPLSRTKLQLSYVCNAWLIGFLFTLIAFIICEVFLVSTGGKWLSLENMLKIMSMIAVSVTLSSMFNLVLVLFTKTQASFSSLSTIVGTSIGFLCGIYVPMIALPDFVQKIIMAFPISHTAVVMRDIFMHDSMAKVFNHAPEAAEQYKLQYGVMYELNDAILQTSTSLLYISFSIILFMVLSLIIFIKRNN